MASGFLRRGSDADEVDQVIGRKLRRLIAPFENAGHEFAFAFVHGEDFFFDRVLRDQAIHGDRVRDSFAAAMMKRPKTTSRAVRQICVLA